MNGAVYKKWRGCIGHEICVISKILSAISEFKFNNGILNIVPQTINIKYVRIVIPTSFQIHPKYRLFISRCKFKIFSSWNLKAFFIINSKWFGPLLNRWTVWLSETHFHFESISFARKKNCQVSGENLIKFSIFEKCSTRCFCECLAPAIDEICLVRSFQWNTLSVLWPHLNHSECTLRIALPYSLGNFFPHFASHYRPNENLITESLQHIYTSHFGVFAVNLCLFETRRVRIKNTLQRYEREWMNSKYTSGL